MTCMWIDNRKRLNWTIWKCIVKRDDQNLSPRPLLLGARQAGGLWDVCSQNAAKKHFSVQFLFLFPSPPLIKFHHQPTQRYQHDKIFIWLQQLQIIPVYRFLGQASRIYTRCRTASDQRQRPFGYLPSSFLAEKSSFTINSRNILTDNWAHHLLQLGSLLRSLLLGLDLLLTSSHFLGCRC